MRAGSRTDLMDGAVSWSSGVRECVFINGVVKADLQTAEAPTAVAVRDGRVIGIGTDEAMERLVSERALRHDLQGNVLMPGFIDAHVHIHMGAQYLSNIGLRDTRTMADLLAATRAYAEANPDKDWLIGHEFSYGYPDLDGDFDRRLLDAVVPDRPVFMYSGMAHAAWANSRALELAGIGAETPDPDNGIIMRRPDGTPTGWLKEKAADLVRAVIPAPTDSELLDILAAAVKAANRLGITRLQSAGFDEELLPLFAKLKAQGRLTLRIGVATVIQPPALTPDLLQVMIERRDRYNDDFIDAGGAKFFLDGVLESHTGSVPEGYADRPDETGMLLWDSEALNDAVRTVEEHGFQPWAHAIGPGAIHQALDAYEAAGALSAARRPRVEHVELPYAEDVPRFAAIGAVAGLQPTMIYPRDAWMGMEGVWDRRVGAARNALAFPLRALLDAGTHVAFGTDWPIVDLNPLLGLRNAVLRRSRDGEPGFNGWVPAQRITIAEALRAYTLDAAFASHREADEGRIAPGTKADFVVLSDDPLTADPDALPHLGISMTVVDGEVVYYA